MIKPLIKHQDWRRLSLIFILILLIVIIMLGGCFPIVAPSPAPTPIPEPSHTTTPEPSPTPAPTPAPKVSYSLSTNVSPPNLGSIIPSKGTYEAGNAVTLTAHPNPGYTFDHWGGDASGTSDLLSITMNSNKSITAYFKPIPMPTSPLNVTIHYIGVISAHDQEDPWDSDGEIQLVVVITDGQMTPEPLFIPPTKQGFKIGDFETNEINRRVFHTSSAGDYLKVSIIAYDIDSKTETLNLLSMFEVLGAPGASELKKIYSLLPQEDDFIGYYENIWYPEENWGIGQYNAEGHEDLRIWFSIWSDKEPAPASRPSLIPDVRIKSVNIPSQLSEWSLNPFILTLVNNEEHDITVNWEAHSSVQGNFDSGSATVPSNSYIDITERYFYDDAGLEEITYTISYKGAELDTWSGTLGGTP